MGAIIVTGIPGVGKTTIMEALAKERALEIVVYGTVMFEEAKKRGLVKDRDAMRKLPPEVQKDVQRAAAVSIAARGAVIVDTHASVKTPRGYLPGLPAWVLTALAPAAIVLVEADPSEIRGRRQKDASRSRDDEGLEAIAAHQEWNRRLAAACAVQTGATVLTVHNHDGKVQEAIQQVLPVVA